MGGAIDFRSGNGNAVVCRLDNGILFRVECHTELMPLTRWDIQFIPQTAGIKAVGNAPGGTVVAGGEDVLVFHDNRTHGSAGTGCPGRNKICHFNKIIIPGWSGIHVRSFGS